MNLIHSILTETQVEVITLTSIVKFQELLQCNAAINNIISYTCVGQGKMSAVKEFSLTSTVALAHVDDHITFHF